MAIKARDSVYTYFIDVSIDYILIGIVGITFTYLRQPTIDCTPTHRRIPVNLDGWHTSFRYMQDDCKVAVVGTCHSERSEESLVAGKGLFASLRVTG